MSKTYMYCATSVSRNQSLITYSYMHGFSVSTVPTKSGSSLNCSVDKQNVIINWNHPDISQLRGSLQRYNVFYERTFPVPMPGQTQNSQNPQVSIDLGQLTGAARYTVEVSACTGAGCGPNISATFTTPAKGKCLDHLEGAPFRSFVFH